MLLRHTLLRILEIRKSTQLLVVIILLISSNASAQMRLLYKDPSAPMNEIQKLSFYSASEGWVAFNDAIGYTSDSGRTYIKKYITDNNVNYNGYVVNTIFGFLINGVKAFNQNTILAYGHYGTFTSILYSNDGGNSFTLVYHSVLVITLENTLFDMVFPENNQVGFALDRDRVIKTFNGGLNWTVVREEANSHYTGLQAIDNNTIFIYRFTNSGTKILRSTTGGNSWQAISTPLPDIVPASFYFQTPSKGWANIEGNIHLTTNSGQNWTIINPSIALEGFSSFRFINDSTGIGINYFEVLKTTDGGRIWEVFPADDSNELNLYTNLQILNNNQLWVAGHPDLLTINTNAGAQPIPKSYFSVDTNGVFATGIVQLNNLSRTHYSFKWYKNNVLISTDYNCTYIHEVNSIQDTIRLEVTNNTASTTSIQYIDFPPPIIPVTITSFSPVSAPEGGLVTITGTQFIGVTSVSFGGTAASSFIVESPTTIKAIVSNGSSGIVRVATPQSFATRAGFTFINPPVITSFSPGIATAGSVITITGNYFENTSSVLIGGIPAANFIYVSPTTISAVVPSGPSGAITVTTPGGTSVMNGFITQPVLTSSSPTAGTFGTYVTVTGSSLTDITSITVGGTPVDTFFINSHHQITVVVGEGSSGPIAVFKTGASASQGNFEWYLPPTVSSIAPLSGQAGSSVTITGTSFNPVPTNNIVYFGSIKAVVTGGSTTSLTVTVPNSAPYAPLSVTNRGLTAYSNKPFMLYSPSGSAITHQSFSEKLNVAIDSNHIAMAFTPGDYDNDGKLDLIFGTTDLASSGPPYTITVLRNTSTGSTVSFSSSTIELTSDAGAMSTADMDGDGKIDLVTSASYSGDVRVMLNTSTPGSISFASPITLAGIAVNYIGLCDLDKDGKTDIYNGETIFRNISEIGQLAFTSKALFLYGHHLILRDIDGDNKEDALVIDNQADGIMIYRNISTKGRVNFATGFAVPYNSNTSISTGDMDGDGKLDLVTYGSSNNMLLIRNTSTVGNFSFGNPVNYFLGLPNTPADLADFNGDGKLDIANGHRNMNLSLFENLSVPGSLQTSEQIRYDSAYIFGDNEVQAADFNGDNKPEIIAGNYATKRVTIYINNVVRKPWIQSFTPTTSVSGTSITISGNYFENVSSVSFGGTPATSFVVNSATTITAVVSTGTSGTIAVTNNLGTGTIEGFNFGLFPIITNVNPVSTASGTDIVLTGNNFNSIANGNSVYFGSTKGAVKNASTTSVTVTVPTGFSPDHPISLTTSGRTAFSSKNFHPGFPGSAGAFTQSSFEKLDFFRNGESDVCDLDGDGKADLLRSGIGGLYVSRNTSQPGTISFGNDNTFAVGGNNNAVQSVGIDVDGDGVKDVVSVANGLTPSISIFKNTSTTGSISFATRKDMVISTMERSFVDIDAADIDRDGRPDIILTELNQVVLILRNETLNGNIIFTPQPLLHTNQYLLSSVVCDLDGDGMAEIISTQRDVLEAVIWRNTSKPGFISFSSVLEINTEVQGNHIDIADLDGDGKSDIIAAGGNFGQVSVRRNTSTLGSLSFGGVQTFGSVGHPIYINLADMDGDGKIDVITHNRFTRNVSVYRNNSGTNSISLQNAVDYTVNEDVKAGVVADFDADGKPDLLVNTAYNSPNILRNTAGVFVVQNVCANGNTSITTNTTGTTYQWQVNTGAGYTNLSNGVNIAGATSVTLQLISVPASWNGYEYRCFVNGTTYSTTSKLNISGTAVTPLMLITGNTTVNQGQSAAIISTAINGGTTPAIQWQDSTESHNWQNIAGATSVSLIYKPAKSGVKLRCLLTTSIAVCVTTTQATSNVLVFTVNVPTAIDPVPASNVGIRLYPNPANKFIVLDSIKLSQTWQTLQIVGTNGIALRQENIMGLSKTTVNIEMLRPGVYTIILRRRKGEPVYLRFIKM